jgi:diadenosine tetraphosphate (Ap4A) HIT family hydrolase
VDDCLFCSVHHTPDDDLVWHDRPIVRDPGVGIAIAAMGSFVPGYVLAAPAWHLSSVQGLPTHVVSGFIGFLTAVVERVTARYGPCTVFEHGSCRSTERRRSACITHAHVHVIPGRYSLSALELPVRSFDDLSAFASVPVQERHDGYLMYQEPQEPVSYTADLGVSQYFRRHIAATLGAADDWDYALFPHWDNMRHTIRELVSAPTTMRI